MYVAPCDMPLEPESNDGRLPLAVEFDVTVCGIVPVFVQVNVALVPSLMLIVPGLNPQLEALLQVAPFCPSKILTGNPLFGGVVLFCVKKYTPTPTTMSITTMIAMSMVLLFGFGASAGFADCSIFSH